MRGVYMTNSKKYIIKNLNQNDLKQIINARIAQENENGNEASQEYIKAYEQSLTKIFKKITLLVLVLL